MRFGLIALFSIVLTCPAFAQEGRTHHQNGSVTLQSADEISRACTLVDIAASAGRVQVQCAPDIGGTSGNPRYLRVPMQTDPNVLYFVTEDSALGDRVIALATAATQQNKRLAISYRSNAAENPSACRATNCRRLTGLVMIVR